MLSASIHSSQNHSSAHSVQAHILALGLTRMPFPVTPDDEQAFFFSSRLNEMYAELKHFIQLRKGFMLVSGDVGVGKTTLTHLLLRHLEKEQVKTALIINTFLQDIELLRAISRDFNIAPQEDTLDGHLQCLNTFFLDAYGAGHNCVLIIDDAQRLSINSLELIRQLSNLETAHDKLLQIVLVAQPEIMETLDRFDLRQLRSRIALHVKLLPLTIKEMDHYLHHRLSLAGSNGTITVAPGAMRELFRATGGFPRLIHLVMDRCLFGLGARNVRTIDMNLMRQAIAESDLRIITPASRRLRPVTSPGSVLVLSVAGILLMGWLFTVSGIWPTNGIAANEESIDRMPIAQLESNEWRKFIDGYPGMQGVAIPELRKYEAEDMDVLEKALEPYQWTPAIIRSASSSCQDFPAHPLTATSGQQNSLILFRTELPLTLIPFSQHDKQVELLQSKLLELGYMTVEEMDGVMGTRTALALARFQKAVELASTGQPDVDSSYALECAVSQKRVWKQ